MGTKRKYSVTVIPDNEVEEFSTSSCSCRECTLMHMAQVEWDSFIPKTNLQRRMKKVIANIELKNNNNNKSKHKK